MKDQSKRFGRSFNTHTGAFIFFALAALAAACLYSTKFAYDAYDWIAELYPLKENFIPTLFGAIGLCALVNLIFLIGAGKLKENLTLCKIHTVFCVLTGVFCGYCVFLLLHLDAFSIDNILDGVDALIIYLPYFAAAIALPLLFLIFVKLGKKK